MKGKLNIMSNFFTKNILNDSDNIKLVLYFSIMLSVVALIYGSLQGGMFNISGIIIVVFMSIFIYLFFQKKYKKRLRFAKKKFQKMNQPNLLTQLCNSKYRNKQLCQQHSYAKNNYNKISEMLLQQYKS